VQEEGSDQQRMNKSQSQENRVSLMDNLPPGKKKTLPAIEKKKKKKAKPPANKDENNKDEIFYLLDEMEGVFDSKKNSNKKEAAKPKADPILKKDTDEEDEEDNKHTSSDDILKDSGGSRERGSGNINGSMRGSLISDDSTIRKTALYLLSFTLSDRDIDMRRRVDEKALISLFESK
jgi:hypothetical protein